jgi:G3E family GTPase
MAATGVSSPVRMLGLYNPATKTADVRPLAGRGRGTHAISTIMRIIMTTITNMSHAHHVHDDRVRSVSLVHDRPVPFSAIEMFFDLLRSTQGEKLLRMKGVIELEDDPDRPLVIHGVQKLMHPPARLPSWPDGPRGTRIVLITYDLPEDYVRRLFSAFTSTPTIDTPDRAAMEEPTRWPSPATRRSNQGVRAGRARSGSGDHLPRLNFR